MKANLNTSVIIYEIYIDNFDLKIAFLIIIIICSFLKNCVMSTIWVFQSLYMWLCFIFYLAALFLFCGNMSSYNVTEKKKKKQSGNDWDSITTQPWKIRNNTLCSRVIPVRVQGTFHVS